MEAYEVDIMKSLIEEFDYKDRWYPTPIITNKTFNNNHYNHEIYDFLLK